MQVVIWIFYLIRSKSSELTVSLFFGFLVVMGIFYYFWGRSNLIPSLFSNNRGHSMEQRVGYVFGKLDQPRIDVVGNLFQMSFNNINFFWRFKISRYLITLFFSSLFILDVKKIKLKGRTGSDILVFRKGTDKISVYLSFQLIFVLFIILCTPLVKILFNSYYYIFILPNLILFISYSLLRFLPKKIFLFSIILFTYASIVGDIDYLRSPHKTEFKKVAEYLMTTLGQGKSVAIMGGGDVCYAMNYYLKGNDGFNYNCVTGNGSEVKADILVSKEGYPESEKYKKVKDFHGLVLLERD